MRSNSAFDHPFWEALLSTNYLETAINEFLRTATPEVLCITGSWGIGKSHAWRTWLKKAKDDGNVACARYAYVSLFGIDTIDQLKYAIFENTIKREAIGTKPDLKSFHENISSNAETLGRSGLNFVTQLVSQFKGVSGGIHAVSYLSVRKQIICFDDLERKGKNLRIQDVLGLVSSLKEDRDCKLVLILNDEKLTDDGQSELRRYQEKVVDRSIVFSPTVEDCIRIASTPKTPARLKEKAAVLKITNIRIFRKLDVICGELELALKGYPVRILTNAIDSTAVLGFGYLTYQQEFLDFALSRGGKGVFSRPPRRDMSESEKLYDSILDASSVRETTEMDRLIARRIVDGYLDEAALDQLAKQMSLELQNTLERRKLESAWTPLLASFGGDEDLIVKTIFETSRDLSDYLTPSRLDQTVSFLKQVGKADFARELLIAFAQKHDRHLPDANDSGITDPDVRELLSRLTSSSGDERNPAEVLENVALTSAWSHEDEKLIKTLSEDDWVALFKGLRGANRARTIRFALSSAGLNVADIATRALERIAGESKLNEARARFFGIKREDEA